MLLKLEQGTRPHAVASSATFRPAGPLGSPPEPGSGPTWVRLPTGTTVPTECAAKLSTLI